MKLQIDVAFTGKFGKRGIYVTSEHQDAIRILTGRKTLSNNDMYALRQLGFTIDPV